MGTPEKRLSELVDIVKSWIPRRTEPVTLSRDFWMPDHSCIVCYECDAQFTIFNRRHHCRICGRIFCGKCTANSIPIPSDEPSTCLGDSEKIRVCNYCFKQWWKEMGTHVDGNYVSSQGLSPSLSAASFPSVTSSVTGHGCNSILDSGAFSTATYQSVPHVSTFEQVHFPQVEVNVTNQDGLASQKSVDVIEEIGEPSLKPFEYCMNRSDEEDDDDGKYAVFHFESESKHYPEADYYYDHTEFDGSDQSYTVHLDDENLDSLNSLAHGSLESVGIEGPTKNEEAGELHNGGQCEVVPSLSSDENTEAEPVDFENNGLLWLPPEPEDEEDEREPVLFEDDDEEGPVTGEWGYLRSSSSFGSGEYRSRERSSEEHKKAMKNVVDGHFRALVSQLLQVENLPTGEGDDKGSWLEIITSLSWEAATLLKPDTSRSGGMDPGGYVKIKCLAYGCRSASVVVKGVVCKKNVAHRRMTSDIDKARFLILGGALEYQRVTNHLSSFDTLLQQEMDHLKMAVAKIQAHHPNVLLVEKSVSRFAQEYLLLAEISLVLNVKRPLLERIARCTGAQIVPSIDHLSSQKLGCCDTFHVEKFLEEHETSEKGGKKSTKTLMFFQGCPKPLGCTILLKGASRDELKKVKHVLQYGVFAAYHLALETSFLADEGASLPEFPLKSPINVALPNKPSGMDRSISIIPGFTITSGKIQGPQLLSESQMPVPESKSPAQGPCINRMEKTSDLNSSNGLSLQFSAATSTLVNYSTFDLCSSPQRKLVPGSSVNNAPTCLPNGEKHNVDVEDFSDTTVNTNNKIEAMTKHPLSSDDFAASEAFGQCGLKIIATNIESVNSERASLQHDSSKYCDEQGSCKEEFPPSPSDHQSILVSLSTRCVWKGTVCERSHLFRIKYYGSFDKPLGRFLRDHLFDKSYCCRSCEMPSEAHVHCYTHRQGSLTISVKKLPEFLLPGERDGKIWMWHRCLRCPRKSGFPPATRRIVMSDAAWGLSFGKFLELSFSNHAAASRVASCGHSLHRDCLRFYGFGSMVACFRYASIDVHSVYLPPAKLEINYDNQEWVQKEANEVVDWAELLFAEVLNSLHQIAEKKSGTSSLKVSESRRYVAELEGILQKEKAEFEEDLHKALNNEAKKGQLVIDILEINRLRRQLLFHSYLWDYRLIYAGNLDSNSSQGLSSSIQRIEKAISCTAKIVEVNSTPVKSNSVSSSESLVTEKLKESPVKRGNNCQNNQLGLILQDIDGDHNPKQGKECLRHLSSSRSLDGRTSSLDSDLVIHRTTSDSQIPVVGNLSDTLDAAWTGENVSGNITPIESGIAYPNAVLSNMPSTLEDAMQNLVLEEYVEGRGTIEGTRSLGSALPGKTLASKEDWTVSAEVPFQTFYSSFNKNSSANLLKADNLGDYNPVYVSSFWELERQSRARLLFPVCVNDTVVPIYDEEPTSIISYTLLSPDYLAQLEDELERPKDGASSASLPLDSTNVNLSHSSDEKTLESFRSLGSLDDSIGSMSVSRSSRALDPLHTKVLHARVSFTGDGPAGKVRYTVTCYYARRFEALRRTCCPSELDFVRCLARCKKWGAQGGKSNVFFAKTMDERFIVKQVTKTELESFIKFGPEYFKYLSESIKTGSPTCLAKILGIYQVTSKHLKGGKESRMDVLVMENLLFRRNLTRLYDLKGSSRSRYNPDSSGNNKVLLDQNLIEAMPTCPIFVGNKAKRLLERAVWNDTSFLASIDVMDYSLLVGVDEENQELVLGIIDFMRQYTWDKHLETWVKASGILGGPKNTSPTVISPKQYKKRFRKAMSAYFLMVPDQWSPPTFPSGSQSEQYEEKK